MMRSNGSITRFTQAALLFALTGCASAPAVQNAAPPVSPQASPIAAPPAAAPASPIAQAADPPQTVRAVRVLEGLEHPWGMAWLPDGALLITERPGRLRIVRDGRLDPTSIAGVPNVFAQRQGGLMDVSVHPQFAQNQLIYFTFADGTEQANRTRLARARFDGRSLQDVQVIFEVTQPKPDGQHFGSRIAWLADSTMLVSIGDGGNPPVAIEGELIRQQAQNLQSRLGKIVRLNDDGSIPSDNPFVNGEGDRAVWSYGHRNIQGLAVDPATNRVWATEHGARGGDELNLVQAGQNYGWPLVTHSREYSGGEISPDRSRPGLVDPKQVWSTIAPSGLMVYSSDRVPAWRGNLFAGGLVSQDIRCIEVDAAGNVSNEQTIEIGQRVRDVRQAPDGQIYVLTDAPNGQLLRLEPS